MIDLSFFTLVGLLMICFLFLGGALYFSQFARKGGCCGGDFREEDEPDEACLACPLKEGQGEEAAPTPRRS